MDIPCDKFKEKGNTNKKTRGFFFMRQNRGNNQSTKTMTKNSDPLNQNTEEPGALAISSSYRLGPDQITSNDGLGNIQYERPFQEPTGIPGVDDAAVDVHIRNAVLVDPDDERNIGDLHNNSTEGKVFQSLKRMALVGLLLTFSITAAVVAVSVLLTRPVTSPVETLPSSLSPNLSLILPETPLYNPTSNPSTGLLGSAAENTFNNQTVSYEPSAPPSKGTMSYEPTATITDQPSTPPTVTIMTDEPTTQPSQDTITDEPSAKPTVTTITGETSSPPSQVTISVKPSAPPSQATTTYEPSAKPSLPIVSDDPTTSPSELTMTVEPSVLPSKATVTDEPTPSPSKTKCVVSSTTKARLCLLLDMTLSQSEYSFGWDFVQRLVIAINTTSPNSTYSIVTFENEAENLVSNTDATTAINANTNHYKGYGTKATDIGFAKCEETFGYGNGKSDVIIILTDGNTINSTKADDAAKRVKEKNTTIVCLGVGSDIKENTLKGWSSVSELTFITYGFITLGNLDEEFVNEIICA